jgi:hypothetical protein
MIEWLLAILVCGAEACHYERAGHYPTYEACAKAAGRPPAFKCVMQKKDAHKNICE